MGCLADTGSISLYDTYIHVSGICTAEEDEEAQVDQSYFAWTDKEAQMESWWKDEEAQID